jgi:uncharacterized protein YraI
MAATVKSMGAIMRRYLLVILLLSSLAVAEATAGTTLSIGVKSGPLRATPTPFGKILATLGYGATVEKLAVDGAWLRVRYGRNEGWMHSSLLSARVAGLSAGQGHVDSDASSEELTLAGKGFNAQVEAEYRQKNRTLDFATIDRMEKMVVSQDRMSRFLADGEVKPEGGTDGQ